MSTGIKTANSGQIIRVTIQEKNPDTGKLESLDLTQCDVYLNIIRYKDAEGAPVVEAALQRMMTITGAKRGKAQYQTTVLDFPNPGYYHVECEVIFNDGTNLTCPANGYEEIFAYESIA